MSISTAPPPALVAARTAPSTMRSAGGVFIANHEICCVGDTAIVAGTRCDRARYALGVEQAARGAGVGVGGVAELRHRFGFDLTDALATEVEMFTHFRERAGLAPVEAVTQGDDHLFPLVECAEQCGDFE